MAHNVLEMSSSLPWNLIFKSFHWWLISHSSSTPQTVKTKMLCSFKTVQSIAYNWTPNSSICRTTKIFISPLLKKFCTLIPLPCFGKYIHKIHFLKFSPVFFSYRILKTPGTCKTHSVFSFRTLSAKEQNLNKLLT